MNNKTNLCKIVREEPHIGQTLLLAGSILLLDKCSAYAVSWLAKQHRAKKERKKSAPA